MLTEKPKRLFVAIDLSDEVKATLSSVSNYFQHPALRWTSPQNLHVTVHFIGMVHPREVEGMVKSVSAIAAASDAFSLAFAGLKEVSKRGKPVMVWAGFERSDAFVKLALQLQQALPGDDSKTPLPHVTLARIKEGGLKALPELPYIEKFSISVNRIELWESQLSAGAPAYFAVEKFALGKT